MYSSADLVSIHFTLVVYIMNKIQMFCVLHFWITAATEKHRRYLQVPSYHVWATVKRRRCRMLLFTSNFLKKHGEFLGELRGEILGDVGLFPGNLGSSSSKCICSLKVFMQTSDSEAVSSFEDSFAVMSYVECWLSPLKTKTSNIAETQLQVRRLMSLQTVFQFNFGSCSSSVWAA